MADDDALLLVSTLLARKGKISPSVNPRSPVHVGSTSQVPTLTIKVVNSRFVVC